MPKRIRVNKPKKPKPASVSSAGVQGKLIGTVNTPSLPKFGRKQIEHLEAVYGQPLPKTLLGELTQRFVRETIAAYARLYGETAAQFLTPERMKQEVFLRIDNELRNLRYGKK